MSCIALTVQEKGEYPKAAESYEAARHMYERLLGPEHPSTLVATTNTGVLLRVVAEEAKGFDKKDLLDRSHELLDRVVKTRTRVCHPDDLNTFRAVVQLAATLRVQVRCNDAVYYCLLPTGCHSAVLNVDCRVARGSCCEHGSLCCVGFEGYVLRWPCYF